MDRLKMLSAPKLRDKRFHSPVCGKLYVLIQDRFGHVTPLLDDDEWKEEVAPIEFGRGSIFLLLEKKVKEGWWYGLFGDQRRWIHTKYPRQYFKEVKV